MSHNDRRRKLWPPTATPTPEELRDFDQRTSEAVNGDEGGLWSPATRIWLGGVGGTVYGAGNLSGPVSTGRRRAAGGGLVLGDSDYPIISPATTRTFVMSLADFFSRADTLRVENDDGAPLSITVATFPHDDASPGTIGNVGSSNTMNSPGVKKRATRLVMPIPGKYLVQGATFMDFGLTWRASFPWGPPASGSIADTYGLPGFRIIRLRNGVYANALSDVFSIPQWSSAVTIRYNPGDLLLPSTGANGHQYRVIVGGLVGPASLVPPWGSHTTNGEVWIDFFSGMQYQTEPGPTALYGHRCTTPWAATAAANHPQVIARPGNCLPTNAVIDLATYSYFAEVYDPTPISAQVLAPATVDWFYHSLQITLSNVSQIRPVY